MSIEDWNKLGYSDEQAKELERLSQISDDIGDIDAHVTDKILRETIKKYEAEKENNIMRELKVYITPEDILNKLSDKDKKRFNKCVFTDVTKDTFNSVEIACLLFNDITLEKEECRYRLQ